MGIISTARNRYTVILHRSMLLLTCMYVAPAYSVQLSTLSANGEVASQNWKALHDAQIVKQAQDFSCGAASLATLLNGFYGSALTEAQILKDMNKTDMMANFDDMARVVNRYGFKAGGMALSYEQLAKLTVPVVVYLQLRGEDHFSVLKGISATHVHLADPSLGNRIFSKAQFLAMWETRDDEKLKGKILLVLPQDAKTTASIPDYFGPPTPSSLPVDILISRHH
jgi:uncharacterized protein